MHAGRKSQLVRDLGRIFGGDDPPAGDRALLDGFARRRDAAAFEALVARHGPMVRGVCRRILPDAHDADDAFQATFLVLLLKARRVRDADRLAPWLFGVATRVALKARARAARRRARLRVWGDGEAEVDAAVAPPGPRADLAEAMTLVDAEVARLPAKLRQAVVLCLVEGTTPDAAARALGIPVGTVKSRLARGREALRARLARRGVAPTVALAAVDLVGPAPVPPALLRLAAAVAARSAVPPTLLALARGVAPPMLAKSTVAALLAGGIALAGGLAATRARPANPAPAPQAQAAPPRTAAEPKAPPPAARDAVAPDPDPQLADRFARIKAEYEAGQAALWAAVGRAADRREHNQIYARMAPDEVAYCRRMIDLALSRPADPAARDALIWVLDKPGMVDEGDYGDEFARAAALLVRHHGDDPVAASAGLALNNGVTAHRDALLFGFAAAARGREARGAARLALAQHLESKAGYARAARERPGRRKRTYLGVVGDDGRRVDKEVDQPVEEYAYMMSLVATDPAAIQAEAERLYREVVADYGDVPSQSPRQRELATLARDPNPTHDGKPLTADERRQLAALAARRPTLGELAGARLDELANVVPGKPAPAIVGTTLDGKPLALADFRGKVVALTFWGSWCGPCLREIPAERELVAKYRGRPFALLGVDCNEAPTAGLKAAEANQMTWPSWTDGIDDGGPIATRYHVRSFPTTFLIDAKGIIRQKGILGARLDEAVAQLLDEAAAGGAR